MTRLSTWPTLFTLSYAPIDHVTTARGRRASTGAATLKGLKSDGAAAGSWWRELPYKRRK